MTLAGAADEDDIALLLEEGASGEMGDELGVDRRAGEVEVMELLGKRQLGDAHLVVDRACLLGGNLGLEQGADHLLNALLALDA
jgi:hypothetical protein